MIKYILRIICPNKGRTNKVELLKNHMSNNYQYIYNKISDCHYITKEDFILINDMANDEKMKLLHLYNESMQIILKNFVSTL